MRTHESDLYKTHLPLALLSAQAPPVARGRALPPGSGLRSSLRSAVYGSAGAAVTPNQLIALSRERERRYEAKRLTTQIEEHHVARKPHVANLKLSKEEELALTACYDALPKEFDSADGEGRLSLGELSNALRSLGYDEAAEAEVIAAADAMGDSWDCGGDRDDDGYARLSLQDFVHVIRHGPRPSTSTARLRSIGRDRMRSAQGAHASSTAARDANARSTRRSASGGIAAPLIVRAVGGHAESNRPLEPLMGQVVMRGAAAPRGGLHGGGAAATMRSTKSAHALLPSRPPRSAGTTIRTNPNHTGTTSSRPPANQPSIDAVGEAFPFELAANSYRISAMVASLEARIATQGEG